MKKHSISACIAMIVLMMTFQFANAQNLNRMTGPEPLTITMEINYATWSEGNWYDAITFSDTDKASEDVRSADATLRRGRKFNSTVRRNQELIWKWELVETGKNENLNIILVSVMRQPDYDDDILLTQPWYNSLDGGKTIVGHTRRAFKGRAEEHYLITFTVSNGNGGYDTYTIDPLITGHL
jgi:hypothetical protein